MRKVLLFVFLFTSADKIVAQDCFQSLTSAQRYYSLGNFRNVKPVLKNCLQNGFTKEQRIEAYRLIALSYLVSKRYDEADSAILLLLKEDPEYRLGPQDPPELGLRMKNKFDRNPAFAFGIKAGINQANYHVINPYSVLVTPQPSTYSQKTGFQFGFLQSYHLTNGFWVTLEEQLEKKVFEKTTNKIGVASDTLNASSTESQLRFNIPLTMRYVVPLKKFSPYIEAGYGVNFLLNDHSLLVSENQLTSLKTVDFSYNMLNLRRKINNRFIVGWGAMFKVQSGFIDINFQYSIEVLNQAAPKNRYSDANLVLQYSYVDDDFKSNTFSLSLAYRRTYFRPKMKR
jgi:hypothetical protein